MARARLNVCPVRCERPDERSVQGATLVVLVGDPDEAVLIDRQGSIVARSPLASPLRRKGSRYTIETEAGPWLIDRQGCRCGGRCNEGTRAARALLA